MEPLHRVLRKPLKTKGSFPTMKAATKLIFWLSAASSSEKGCRAVRDWVAARNQPATMFAGRVDA